MLVESGVRIWRIVYNAALDLKYGYPLSWKMPTRFAHLGASPISWAGNSDYIALRRLFAGRIYPSDVLVDVGCGKGRVLNWWLSQGLDNKLIGIELDPAVAEKTRRRLRGYQNVTVIAGDAVECLPPEGTLFYLYNPFNREVFAAFEQALAALARSRGGGIRIIYNKCEHLTPFLDSPDWQVEYIDIGGLASVEFDRAAAITYVGARPGTPNPAFATEFQPYS
jgi:hypothetical protein